MRLTFSSMQWMIFILASIIVAPLSVGHAFGMSSTELTGLLQRTFFVMGLGSFLQGLFGHRLPLLNGPAGLWWSVFLIFAGFVSSAGQSAEVILRSLELGMFISGMLFIVLSTFKLMNLVKTLFTPVVTGTYLVLLVAQMSGSFIKGMFGVGYLSSGVNPVVAVCAIITLIFSMILSKSRNRFLSSYSVLISMAFGWLLFVCAGISKPLASGAQSLFSFPHLFAWGVPEYNLGVVLTSIFTAFLLMANMVASVNVVASVSSSEAGSYNRSGFIMGVNQMLAGLFSCVGGVPMSSAAGFITTTKIRERLPFLLGSATVLLISLFPTIMAFFASIPMPVGYATIFLSISSLLGLALTQFREVLHDDRAIFIISFSMMAGLGAMFVPEKAWDGLPYALTSVFNNGLVVGVILCIFLEQVMKFGRNSGNHMAQTIDSD